MSEYEKQARTFCRETGTHIRIRKKCETFFVPGWPPPNGWRSVYRVTIERNGERYTTTFYDSIANYQANRRPTPYDVLACLQKYPVGNFWDFVAEFGYSTEGRQNFLCARQKFEAVRAEYAALQRLFGCGSVMDRLREIQ